MKSNIDNYFILKENFGSSNLESVGVKAHNLIKYGLNTPDYIILSSHLFKIWASESNLLPELELISNKIADYFQEKNYISLIIRSSAIDEKFGERGQFLSEICKIKPAAINQSIINIFNDFKNKSDLLNSIALIIQEYKKPIVQGHLSNERRVTHKTEQWIVEKENISEKNIEVSKIKIPNRSIEPFDYSIFSCLNNKSLNNSLTAIAAIFTKEECRFHIEWLWDGIVFWIIQIDEEFYSLKSSIPGSDWNKGKWNQSLLSRKDPTALEVFETVDTSRKNWPKIECVKLFAELDLPYWQIYILENEEVIESLINGKPDLSLISDLKTLLISPVVIRSDVRDNQELLLARTDTVFELSKALNFLVSESKRFKESGLGADQFCFLIHKFIVSVSGALSYTKPHLDRIRIDSTFGIVDGLYFYPHDSFEVDLKNNNIAKKIRCKYKYVDFDENGIWYAKEAGINYDWKQSLTERNILDIAKITQLLVERLEKPATIMFFINKKKGLPEILPWFYSIDEIVDSKTDYTKVIFSEKKFVIKTKEDYYRYKSFDFSQHKKHKLKLCLDVELLRDKDFIEEIGDFAVENEFVVDIEGSILSHPYYVLKSKGVIVRCLNPLDFSPLTKEFYKLVRDKIPIKIENQNETVISTKVFPGELLRYLKEKAVEEAYELYWSVENDNTIEELSDLFEVILGVCKAYGINLKEIEQIARKKRAKRGGFDEGVYLIATKDNSLFQLTKPENKLFPENNKGQNIDLPAKPVVKFFNKGKIRNLKSLSKVDNFELSYINTYKPLSNKFRYILKPEIYNSISIEYKEKCIKITLDNLDFESTDQMDLFKDKKQE